MKNFQIPPPGNDHTSYQTGSWENHRLKRTFGRFWEGICDRSQEGRNITITGAFSSNFCSMFDSLKICNPKKNINPIYQKDLSWQTLSLCIYSNLTLYNILYTIYLWSDSDSYKYLHMIIIYKTLKRLTKTTTRPQTLKGFPQSPSSSHETPRNGTSVRPKDSTSDSHSEEATELAGRDEVDRKPSRPWALWDVFFLLVGNQNAELGGKILCVCVLFFFERD